jgi:hypothetical protein
VQSENRSGKPRSGYAEPFQDFDQQQSCSRVQENIDQVVKERRVSPNPVFDPKE